MAARLDGSSDALTRSTNLPSITAFTMLGWFKMSTSRSTYQAFLSFGKTDGATFYYGGTKSDNTTQMTYNGSIQLETGGTTLSIGTWYFAAIVCDGTGANNFRYYINGANLITGAGNAAVTAVQMYIGGDTSGSDWLNGCAENVLVYSAALTLAEIQQQMWQRMPLRTANLNGWYPLLNDSKDYSGNGNNLTEGGTITWEAGPGVGWRRGRRRTLFPASAASSSFSHTAGSVLLTRKTHIWTLGQAHTAGAVAATRKTHTQSVATPHTAGSLALTRRTHVWSLSHAHTKGAAGFTPGAHAQSVASPHTALAISLTRGTHAGANVFPHTAGAVSLVRGTHTWALSAAHVAGAVALTRRTHVWAQSHLQAGKVIQLTAGTHAPSITFPHTAAVLRFTPGTHGNPEGYNHTVGAVRWTPGVHVWSYTAPATAGSVTLTRRTHTGFFGQSHQATAFALTRGAHTWVLAHLHSRGSAGYTPLTHTGTFIANHAAKAIGLARGTHAWSYSARGTAGAFHLVAGSHHGFNPDTDVPPLNANLSTPMYAGVTLTTRLDAGAALSTPL